MSTVKIYGNLILLKSNYSRNTNKILNEIIYTKG